MAKKDIAPEETGLKELKNALKTGAFARLYFFYGEERYLQEHYLSALKKKLVSGPMEEFNYRRLTAEGMSLEALQDAVEAMPMMADMTMVQVDDYNPYAQDDATRRALTALFSDIPETCCLVFNFDTVSFSYGAEQAEEAEQDGKKSAAQSKKELKACIEEHGVAVNFGKQTGTALLDWIARHFYQGYEKTISPDLCQYLAFLTDGDMTTLHTEISKVAAYSRLPAVTKQDIDAVVEPVLTAMVFDITDALAVGDYDKALLKLRHVLASQEDPIKILGVIGSHFRKLQTTKTVLAAGKGTEALMPLLGTRSSFYVSKLMQQTRRLSDEMCANAVLLCFETDYKMKRSYDDSQRLLELLLLSLAQEARK